MSDTVDKASELVQQEIDNILTKRQTVFIGESAINCIECGEPIPQKRRHLLKGCKLCVDCQEISERLIK